MRRPPPLSISSAPRRAFSLVGIGSLALAAGSDAAAQIPTDLTFSVDFQGPLIGELGDSVGNRITEGDILIRRGGFFDPESPQIARDASFLDRYQQCAGHLPGISCGVEINALSYGRDARLNPDSTYEFSVYLSVDEWAVGRPVPSGTVTPTIFSEALNEEAAADVFAKRFTGPGPFGLNPGQSVGIADGNGRAAAPNLQPFIGLGLQEPIPRSQQAVDAGDNLDAFDLGPPIDQATTALFFSLQGAFPLCQEPGVPLENSADQQPIVAGGPNARAADVLVLLPGGQVLRYAAAQALGLDALVDGSDDIDALVVVENGIPGYQPPTMLYDWTGPNPSDVIFFSVRCGSDVVDLPDSNFGVPITEGDILVTLANQTRPGIFIGAEALGLETVSRGGLFNDELNGMDMGDGGDGPFADCNMNGQEDGYDISDGTSLDADLSGIPDECEEPGEVFCGCARTVVAPCGNTTDASSGCRNGNMLGAKLIGGGTSSVSTDALTMNGSDLPPNEFALVFMGDMFTSLALDNGRLCIGTPQRRLSVASIDPFGNFSYGPGILGLAATLPGPPAPPVIASGTTWGFQAWYRDPTGPCAGSGAVSNLTNGVRVTLTP